MAVRIALVGDRDPKYLTHRELDACIALMPSGVEARWVATDGPDAADLDGFDALWIVPGTPYRAEEPVLAAIEHARCEGVPILGTCGGFQHMLVEFARNAAGMPAAAHAETDPDAATPVVSALGCSLVGERRTVVPVPGTLVAKLCGDGPFTGFHWCSYGLEPAHLERLVAAGLVVSATAEAAGVEAVELPDHPFYVATLFQPQVGTSQTGALHPLVAALVRHACGGVPAA
jgi:CTP synthase (UTP-ammonia lyase)